ncbi:caspase-3-like [Mizuhopecten yessoensis]|uniref:Caspase-3 n=1 Tax=Mizuhopecten yessoensis TaxID=6573 RepID=A0A210QPF7_MIZYE|nr:caspase-3-like [Mizuhopecten yessoensis]OWF50601.1 Caspase-3 [Mizuhopecten yessoensis]
MTDQADASQRRKEPIATEVKQDLIANPSKNASSKLPVRSQQDLQSKVYRFKSDVELSRKALIVNNLSQSTGEKDSDLMENNLKQFGFTVRRVNQLTIEDLQTDLTKESKDMACDTDCFVCVVLALGGSGYIKGFNPNAAATKKLPIEKLCEPFQGNNCKPLVMKPKIFIVMSWDKEPGSRLRTDGDMDEPKIFKLPTESDVLVYVCHMSGLLKQGYDENGSWLIKSLSDVMQKERGNSKRRDFLSLLTIVNREMANKYKGTELKRSECIPTVTSTLTKLIYL